MNGAQAWKTLGIARTADAGVVRRAYAEKLKAFDPDSDPAAFARLRDARDTALAIARSIAKNAAALPEITEQSGGDQTVGKWPLAAPSLAHAPSAVSGISAAISASDLASFPPILTQFCKSIDPGPGNLPKGDPFSVPALGEENQASLGQMVVHGPPPDQRLWSLLYANGNQDETPLTDSELGDTESALEGVIADAEGGNIALHEAVEHWLANTLAGSWPRCSPLVERAATYFGWEREAGQLGERPGVAFLNARLKGMRFVTKVEQPSHRLHKAWVELSKPGRRNALGNWQVNKQDVRTLIDGVRKNFPEVESYLDPQRVASWEGGASAGNGSGSGFSWRLLWFGVILLIQIVRFATSGSSDTANPSIDPPENALVVQQAVVAAFGSGTIDSVNVKNPELASLIRSNVSMDKNDSKPEAETVARVLSVIRERAYWAARDNGGIDFDNAMRIRLAALRAARQQSVRSCMDYLKFNMLDSGIVLPLKVIKSDQTLSNAMLVAGKLLPPATHKAESAMVPGALIGRVIETSGVTDGRVRKAMKGEGSDEDRCKVHIALLAATLEYRGKERTAILRTL